MDDGATSAAGGTSSCGGIVGGSHHLIGSRIEQHRKHMSELSCCPRCGHKIDRKLDWVGLPAGVKYDPTDQELIEHLEAKVRPGGTTAEAALSHPLIDEFIPTIEGEDGICYTHPEKLPGVSKDGLSRHFFHRPSKAYTTGTRKRRKIQPPATADAPDVSTGVGGSVQQQQQRSETRWHKTGKTRPVAVGGRQRGCKKILVLYTNFGKHRKPEKTNWVMHQYHLGESEEEREGELVVSKIFYQTQPRQCSIGDGASAAITGTSAVDKKRVKRAAAAEPAQRITPSDMIIRAAFHGGAPAGIEDFSFTHFRNSFEEVGMGRSDHQVVQARADEVVLQRSAALHHHQHHVVDVEHDHRRRHQHYAGLQEQQRAAAALFNISTQSDPISTLIAVPRAHQGSVVLTAPMAEPYDHGAASYHHQQEDERPHQTRKFDGRSTSGLEEVIMGCTSRRSKGETSGNKEGTEWQYASFWPSDNQDHHG